MGSSTGWLKNHQDTDLPPRAEWLYDASLASEPLTKWTDNDQTLKLDYTTLSPCKLVRVAGSGRVLNHQSSRMGDYRFASITFVNSLKSKCCVSTRYVIICKTSSASLTDYKKDGGVRADLYTRKAADRPRSFCSWERDIITGSSAATQPAGSAL